MSYYISIWHAYSGYSTWPTSHTTFPSFLSPHLTSPHFTYSNLITPSFSAYPSPSTSSFPIVHTKLGQTHYPRRTKTQSPHQTTLEPGLERREPCGRPRRLCGPGRLTRWSWVNCTNPGSYFLPNRAGTVYASMHLWSRWADIVSFPSGVGF
jgi:hypothetical protein